MTKCDICGTRVPEGQCEHVTPYEHLIDGHKFWSNVTGGGAMHCDNCGYKMRFVGGQWACDSCTNTQEDSVQRTEQASYKGVDALDNADSLTVVCQLGRVLHGDLYHEDDAKLTDAQRGRLAELDAEISVVLGNYRQGRTILAGER